MERRREAVGGWIGGAMGAIGGGVIGDAAGAIAGSANRIRKEMELFVRDILEGQEKNGLFNPRRVH